MLDDARGNPFTALSFLPHSELECCTGFGHALGGKTAKLWGGMPLWSGMSHGESVPLDEKDVVDIVGDGGEVGEKVEGEN